jgi:hypothetical protein
MAVATIAHKEAAGDLAMVYATKLLDAIKAQLLHELGYEPELVAVAMAEKAKACLERLRGAGYKVEIVRG